MELQVDPGSGGETSRHQSSFLPRKLYFNIATKTRLLSRWRFLQERMKRSNSRQLSIYPYLIQLESHKECIYDRVVIYEGSSEGSIPIDILCGQTTQGTHVRIYVFC